MLWQPGMDHAGIATQMVVERQLMERQQPDRRTMGRQAFLDRVWAWKDESGGTIKAQLQRLGASCDWSRERFTMDEGLSEAVLEVFVRLYKQKLIYKDKRLVNWDPKFQTAISDLEVEQKEMKGSSSGISAIAIEGSRPHESPSRRPARRRCWAIRPSPCTRATSAMPISSARWSSCRWPAGASRSLPTIFGPGEGIRRGENHARA